MILDSLQQFSSAQAITTTANGSLDLDMGAARDLGLGQVMALLIVVTTTFTAGGAATLTPSLVADTASGFGSATTVWTGSTFALASLTAGILVAQPLPAIGKKQYLRTTYTVATGPMTAGAVSAWIAPWMALQQWLSYAKNFTVTG